MKRDTYVRNVAFALLFASSVAGVNGASAAEAEAPRLGGPAIPGVCLLSRQAVLANAAVGKSASAQIAKLTDEAQAEVLAERKSLEDEARNLEGQRTQLAPEKYAEQQQAMARRWAELQWKADHRNREIEATRQKAVESISSATQPVIAAEYTKRKCGLLLDRGVAIGGNLSGDLTAAVVEKLDDKVTHIPIQREVLPMAPVTAHSPAR